MARTVGVKQTWNGKKLYKGVAKAADKTVSDTVRMAHDIAEPETPVDTGELVSSLEEEIESKGLFVSLIEGRVSFMAPHSSYVELGTTTREGLYILADAHREANASFLDRLKSNIKRFT